MKTRLDSRFVTSETYLYPVMLLIRKKLGKYLVLYKSLKSDRKIDAD